MKIFKFLNKTNCFYKNISNFNKFTKFSFTNGEFNMSKNKMNNEETSSRINTDFKRTKKIYHNNSNKILINADDIKEGENKSDNISYNKTFKKNKFEKDKKNDVENFIKDTLDQSLRDLVKINLI
jgi:hypothetical protein